VNFVVPEGGLVGPTTNSLSIPEGAVEVGSNSAAGAYSEGSTANVGDTTANVGDVKSASGAISGGNETTQAINVDASDNSMQSIRYDNDWPVSTAAAVYANVCQQGTSGQGKDWGASVVTSDALCDEMKVAAMYWEYHVLEHNHGNDEQAAYWKEKYIEQMKDIETLMEATKEVAIADRFTGFLIKPVALIALLVFLL
jgi:hypothetical protein